MTVWPSSWGRKPEGSLWDPSLRSGWHFVSF